MYIDRVGVLSFTKGNECRQNIHAFHGDSVSKRVKKPRDISIITASINA